MATVRFVRDGFRHLLGDHVPSVTRLLEAGLERSGLARAGAHVVAGPIVVALFLASLSVVLDELVSAAVWLDVPAFRIASFIRGDAEPEILVLTIQPRFFQTDFHGRTPIPREPFKKLLSEVVRTFDPPVLAVDYDLSPDETEQTPEAAGAMGCGADAPNGVPERTALDCYLASLGGKLVLIAPLPVADAALCASREPWLRWMERQGVALGRSDLVMRGAFQSVSTYEIRLDSFAALAECKASANTGGPSACRAPRARCETAAQMADRPVDRAALREIDFVHTDAGAPTCALERSESIRGCAERFRGRRFRAVFVGGDYDWGDRFYTVMGARPGVALHAYSAYSMTHPLRAGHGWDFLVDVVVGAVAGVLLLRSWGHFGLYGLAKRCWRVVRSFSILVLAFLVVIILVPWWFGVWTNPSLTLLGLFAKSWHTSIHQVGLAAHRRPRLRDQIVGLGYGAGWIVVVLWAVSLMLFTEH